MPHDGEVVGDEQVREAELALELLHEIDDLRLNRDVERGYGLVADDQLGVQRERPGEADPLALAAGELVWVARSGVGRKADDLEELPDSRPDLGTGCHSVDPQRLAHDPSPPSGGG